MLDTSPSSQSPGVTSTGAHLNWDLRVDCGKTSQAARKMDILGVLVGNYPYW